MLGLGLAREGKKTSERTVALFALLCDVSRVPHAQTETLGSSWDSPLAPASASPEILPSHLHPGGTP
ncbi:hypothetical protein PoB_003792000 [Plakobranchus ocellatus]|uniref:Uncharacterized protein n=1 Tax=Plakobranchus ocellatus TaxID=259542 RepID=A0AAV4AX58_9GAST|nr:hypothetical protein PoB_003792000 [Plakobranchus ocellatus]